VAASLGAERDPPAGRSPTATHLPPIQPTGEAQVCGPRARMGSSDVIDRPLSHQLRATAWPLGGPVVAEAGADHGTRPPPDCDLLVEPSRCPSPYSDRGLNSRGL